MTTLYHGSDTIIRVPEIRMPNRTLDFGVGFYLTSSFEQAEAWIKRKLQNIKPIGYINVFHFDEQLADCKTLVFDKPDEKWLDFVMANRTQPDFEHAYDIVKGPVANDRVYASFALFEGGFISKSELIDELKTYKLVDQYLFHTELSLTKLQFIEAKEIVL